MVEVNGKKSSKLNEFALSLKGINYQLIEFNQKHNKFRRINF